MSNTLTGPGTLTRAIYWAAQPLPVQALKDMPVGVARTQKAAGLAAGGYLIDLEIMVYNADPLPEMTMRGWYGLVRVPAATSADILSGMPVNDAPAGYFQVSTDAAAFPPVPVPTPPAPVMPTAYVGTEINPAVFDCPDGTPAYQTNQDDVQSAGQVVLWTNKTNNGAPPGFYRRGKGTISSPFGQIVENYYELIAPPASMDGVVIA